MSGAWQIEAPSPRKGNINVHPRGVKGSSGRADSAHSRPGRAGTPVRPRRGVAASRAAAVSEYASYYDNADICGRRMTPAFARLPVLAIAGATGAVLLAVSGRFGYFGDELYFLASGRYHSAWGYADNPWLLPQLARLLDLLTPGSVIGLRLLPMLVTVLGVVFS